MQTNLPAEFRLFLEKIIEEAHGPNISPELRESMIKDLSGRLQNHVFSCLIEAYPDEKKEEMDKFLLTDPTQEQTEEFLKNNIPNIHDVTASAMLEFRAIYVGASAKI